MKLRKIIFKEDEDTVNHKDVHANRPIFAKREGVICGMVVSERSNNFKWILRTGGKTGCSGHHDTRECCIKDAVEYGYEFFT